MALTVIIELVLAGWVIFRHRNSKEARLIVLILLALAVFQIAEYGICEGLLGVHPNVLARIGFASITLLPVLGLHLISTIGGAKQKVLIIVAYASMLMWIAVFLLSDALQQQICGGNYVIFNLSTGFGGSFFVYYYLWLLIGATWALSMSISSKVLSVKKRLNWMVVGYGSFAIPSTLIWILSEEAAKGLPSVMCGFAVIFAIVLAAKVTPKD